jgi:hypothetical protein
LAYLEARATARAEAKKQSKKSKAKKAKQKKQSKKSKANTGVLHCVQDDGTFRMTASNGRRRLRSG